MTDDLAARGDAFRWLHHSGRAFVVPNPWDRGTARLLAHLGFDALATTSAGHAAAAGHLMARRRRRTCSSTSPTSPHPRRSR